MPSQCPDPSEESIIIETWQRLAALQWLTFESAPGPRSRSGWAGCGQGTVEVEVEACRTDQSSVLRWYERGQFTPHDSGRSLQFANIYRWQRIDDRLLLFHERFGSDQPVFLFALTATDSRRMTSCEAHVCGADRYRACLALCPGGLTMDWRITGPMKDEVLTYHYSDGPPGDAPETA